MSSLFTQLFMAWCAQLLLNTYEYTDYTIFHFFVTVTWIYQIYNSMFLWIKTNLDNNPNNVNELAHDFMKSKYVFFMLGLMLWFVNEKLYSHLNEVPRDSFSSLLWDYTPKPIRRSFASLTTGVELAFLIPLCVFFCLGYLMLSYIEDIISSQSQDPSQAALLRSIRTSKEKMEKLEADLLQAIQDKKDKQYISALKSLLRHHQNNVVSWTDKHEKSRAVKQAQRKSAQTRLGERINVFGNIIPDFRNMIPNFWAWNESKVPEIQPQGRKSRNKQLARGKSPGRRSGNSPT